MADLLVTGTDTGVGKTVVAAALLLATARAGREGGGLQARRERGRSRRAPRTPSSWPGPRDPTSRWPRPLLRLAEPLAPAVAADRAGLALDPAAVEARVRGAARGGLPRGGGRRRRRRRAPGLGLHRARSGRATRGSSAIVVARAGPGHPEPRRASPSRRCAPAACRWPGVVLNGRGDPPDLAEQTNPDVLPRLLPGVPRRRDATHDRRRARVRSPPPSAARHPALGVPESRTDMSVRRPTCRRHPPAVWRTPIDLDKRLHRNSFGKLARRARGLPNQGA